MRKKPQRVAGVLKPPGLVQQRLQAVPRRLLAPGLPQAEVQVLPVLA